MWRRKIPVFFLSDIELDDVKNEPLKAEERRARRRRNHSIYLNAGERHTVWKPKHSTIIEGKRNKKDILERRRKLLNRVWATQQVLKVQRETLASIPEENEEEGSGVHPTTTERKMWQKAIAKVIEQNPESIKKEKKSMHFHDIVSQYVAAMSTSDCDNAAAQTPVKVASFSPATVGEQ